MSHFSHQRSGVLPNTTDHVLPENKTRALIGYTGFALQLLQNWHDVIRSTSHDNRCMHYKCTLMLIYDDYNYLHQGGYVFTLVCLFVC